MPVIGRDKLKRPAAVRGLCRAHLANKTQRRSNPCTLCDPRPSIFTPLPGPSRFETGTRIEKTTGRKTDFLGT